MNDITTIRTRRRQAGLTLLELTVVLLILVGLAGLVLPYAQGYLQRTHDGTGNDNLWELNNAVGLFQTKYFMHPSAYHSLVDPNGLYGDLMATAYLTTFTNSAAKAALKMAGVTQVWTMKDEPNSDSATFDAVSALVSTTAAATSLAVVTVGGEFSTVPRHLSFAFYGNSLSHAGEFDNANCAYVVLGVGDESEMVGKVMASAPVHFAAQPGMGPHQKYNRFVTVYQVPRTAPGSCKTKFVGSAMLMKNPHLVGLAHQLAHTWENMGNKED